VAVKLILKHVPLDKDSKILEISTLPFISAALANKYKLEPYIASIETLPQDIPPYHFRYCNLNFEMLTDHVWDLVIITEVWEHLVESLIEIRDDVLKSIKTGGFMLTSFPYGQNWASMSQYQLKIVNYSMIQAHKAHFREFTADSIRRFLKVPGIEIVAEDENTMNVRTVLCKVIS
jgi:hypothetical protein